MVPIIFLFSINAKIIKNVMYDLMSDLIEIDFQGLKNQFLRVYCALLKNFICYNRHYL